MGVCPFREPSLHTAHTVPQNLLLMLHLDFLLVSSCLRSFAPCLVYLCCALGPDMGGVVVTNQQGKAASRVSFCVASVIRPRKIEGSGYGRERGKGKQGHTNGEQRGGHQQYV